MKNYSFSSLFILFLGCLCWFGLPWWSMAVIGALAGMLFKNSPMGNFSMGFATGTLLWSTVALIQNNYNTSMLAGKVGLLFQGLTSVQLIWATGALGGLLTGMGALTGTLLMNIFEKKKKKSYFA